MTLKFNFYDIYGFALPGFILLAVLWLPFALLEQKLPDTAFSSALVGVILAYVAGHILQTVAHHALPSTLPNGRYPSNTLLDADCKTFSQEFRIRLANQIWTAFQLNISPDTLSTDENVKIGAVDRVRADAFFLCRSSLIKSKTATYPEQFEGLYALMRGLSAVFAVGVVYYLGWVFSTLWKVGWLGVVVLLGLIIASFAGTPLRRKPRDKVASGVMRAALLVATFGAGYYLGMTRVGTVNYRGQLIVAAVFSFFASERCFAGYRTFAEEFAKSVYRDFSNYEKPAEENELAADDDA